MITARANQSLFDIAVEKHGSIDTVFLLAKQNELQLTDIPGSGTELDEEAIAVADASITLYYSNKKIIPATADIASETTPLLEGISIWGIEIDFIVS